MENEKLVEGCIVKTSEGDLMVEGIVMNGEGVNGCDHTMDATVEMECKSGVFVEDPDADYEYIFIDHYQIDHVSSFVKDNADD